MHPTPSSATPVADLAPSHAEIEQCARELWTNSGRPDGRDEVIWLEAERRLMAARRAPLPLSTARHLLIRWHTPGRLVPHYRLTWTR
jgi:hypothetical protein